MKKKYNQHGVVLGIVYKNYGFNPGNVFHHIVSTVSNPCKEMSNYCLSDQSHCLLFEAKISDA